jgi:hypothetical protein
MNRSQALVVFTVILALCAVPLVAQNRRGGGGAPMARVSPHDVISSVTDGTRVTIYYGRPYSKAPNGGDVRKIWGTLVPWDQAWRMGSDEATTLVTQGPIQVGSTTIPGPAAYTLYFVPSKDGTSKLAFSKAIGGWGIPVNEKEDLVRVDVTKDAPLETGVDQFTMAFEPVAGQGTKLKWMWENTQYSVMISVKK